VEEARSSRVPIQEFADRVTARFVPGPDVAIEASDVTLVSGELTKVVEAIRLSKATFRKIVQNLFWAFLYNLAAVPIAAIGLLHPMIGVIAMTTSSLSVIGNSVLLKRAKLK
jgi:P-type Cu+ transporter